MAEGRTTPSHRAPIAPLIAAQFAHLRTRSAHWMLRCRMRGRSEEEAPYVRHALARAQGSAFGSNAHATVDRVLSGARNFAIELP